MEIVNYDALKNWNEFLDQMRDWTEDEVKNFVHSSEEPLLIHIILKLSTWEHPITEPALHKLADEEDLDFDDYETYDDLFNAVVVGIPWMFSKSYRQTHTGC